MEWFGTYALALALSVPAANESPDVEIRFDASSHMYKMRIGDAVVLAKNATLTLTGGDEEQSGGASFAGGVTVIVNVEGHSLQCHCERAAYRFETDTWTFEKAALWHTKDGEKTSRAYAERATFNPRALRLKAE